MTRARGVGRPRAVLAKAEKAQTQAARRAAGPLRDLRVAQKTATRYRKALRIFFLRVQSAVLPKYGLEGSPKGVMEMLSQFAEPHISASEEFQKRGDFLNWLLFHEEEQARQGSSWKRCWLPMTSFR